MDMARPSRPISRHGFEIAVICALTLEADAVEALFDIYWDENGPPFDKARGDPNAYSTGAIGRHNVVLAYMPGMGKASAAVVASNCRMSFPNITLALVVGVCGVVPFGFGSSKTEIVLGDVVISDGVIQYDFGRRLPDSFKRKDTLLDSLGRPNLEIRGLLAKLKGLRGRKQLSSAITKYLGELQQEPLLVAAYPGAINDRLFEATYRHMGDKETCEQVGCNGSLVQRQRLQTTQEALQPAVHFGLIASGDSVMKSGEDRDIVAAKEGVVAFEMESAGVWDIFPCVVIKSACDYADSHKSKLWQHYAAATAAACTKGFLSQWVPSLSNEPQITVRGVGLTEEIRRPCYYIQLAKNTRFTGRATILTTLEKKFFGQDQSQRVALVGLGGVGKTQIALHFAYQMKEKRSDYSIFWVPVLSDESAEQALAEIVKRLNLQKSSEEEDVKELVCRHLNSDEAGKWLLIIDNADDPDLVFGSRNKPGLEEYFPQSENGIILLTTRSGEVADEFAQSNVIDIEQMDKAEATDLLKKSLARKQLLQDEALVAKLLTHLTFLPLAITQAASYLNQTKAPLQTYLALLQGANDDVTRVLGREFKDSTRYKGVQNAVGTTWLVSFNQIERSDPAAVGLLSFISCMEPKAIPRSILPNAGSEEMEWAVGMLCSYSFLVHHEDSSMFDMHSLVHTATRGWVDKQGRRDQVADDAIVHLANIFPPINHELRKEYLPHATRLLEQSTERMTNDVYLLHEKVGDCFNKERRPKEAARCYKKLCSWNEDRLPEKDQDRLALEHKLASAYLDDRRIEDAIKILEHVVTIRKESLDEKDHDRLASEHELASAYLNNRQIEDAIKMLERVVAVRKETLDKKDHNRLVSEHTLASAYLGDRRIKDAIKILEHVVAVEKETLDEKDHDRLTSEHELARAYLEDGQIEDATKILEHVVIVQEETLDEKDHDRLISEYTLASAYLNDRRIEDAIKILEHVVTVWKETLDEKDHDRLASEHKLASAYLGDRRIKDAIKILEHVVAVRKETLDKKDHNRLVSEHTLASAYLGDRRIKDAIKILEHVVAVEKETLDEKDHDRLISEYTLASAYLNDRRIEDAIKILEHVVTVWKETLDEKDHDRLASEHELARAYIDDRRIEDAITILEHVVAVQSEILALDDPDRLLSVALLRDAYERMQASDDNI